MVMAEVAALAEVLVTEVAVMMTPVSGNGGAVYVTAVPLAEVVELNVPQGVAPLQLQVTPPLEESLDTVAVMEVWLLTVRGLETLLSETVMGWELLLLHATSAAIIVTLIRRRIDLRNVIGHLR